MTSPIVAGFLTGLAVAAPIGPTGTEVIKRGLRGGFWSGFATALGAVTADLTYLTLVALGVAKVLTRFTGLKIVLWVFGFGMLLYLGVGGLRDAWKGKAEPNKKAVAAGGSYLVGLGITLGNPVTIVLWLSVGGALISTYVAGNSPAQIATLLGSIAAGVVGWFTTLSVAVAFARQFVNQRVLRIISVACNLVLLGFAAKFGGQAFSALAPLIFNR